MKKYIFFVLMFVSQLVVNAQNPCVIFFDTEASTDTYVDINVKANGFTGVVGFQMYINWDSLVLQYDTIVYENPDLPGIEFSTGGFLPDGYLSAQWLAPQSQAKTFEDGTTLFTMRLFYAGNSGDQTDIILKDLPDNRENKITYDTDEEYSINYEAYTVTVPDDNNGGNTTGVGFDIDDVIAPKGTTVCVPIYVDSFQNIGSLDLTICFDNDVISFVEVKDDQLRNQGAIVGSFVENDNVFKYSMSAGNNPISIENGGILMELCFSVIGDDGEVGHINFCGDVPVAVAEYTNGDELPYHTENGSVTVGDISNTVVFLVSEEKAQKSSSVCVDFTAKNFNNIQAFQYMVKWDSTILKWKEFGSVNNIGINPSNFNLVDASKAKITWQAPFSPISIADDTILYQMCFDVIGDCNDSTDLTIYGSSAENFVIEVINGDGSYLPHQEVPGKVKVICLIEIDDYTIKNVTCHGGSDGQIFVTLNVDANTCNFSWTKDGVQISTSSSITALKAGTYKLKVTDKNDPSIFTEKTFVVKEPAPMKITEEITPVTCDHDGSIKLTVTGNNPPYTYKWTPSSIGNVSIATNLKAGNYSVTVQDSKGCPPASKDFSVPSEIDELKVTYTLNDITCKDANDGSISLSIQGGCKPYSVNWEDGLVTLTRTHLAPGQYKVTVTDSKGTTKTLDFKITNPEKELTISGVVHEGNPASIEITVEGGEGTKTFNWTGPNGFTSTEQNLTGLTDAGQYTVTVTDERGCVKTATFEVKGIIDPITIDLQVIVKGNNGYGVKCNGDCNGTITATINANAPWEVYLNDEKITLPYHELCAGTYTLKVVDREGKTVDTTFTVTEPDPLEVEVEEVNCVHEGKDDGSIKVKVTGGVPDYEFDWGIPGEDSDYIENLPKGTYSVVVTDANGCQATSGDIVLTDCDRSNCYTGSLILTPNGDEFNEYFLIQCMEDFESNELHVFDRLGNEVYYIKNYDGTWNGIDNSNKPLPEDSYMWVFIGTDANGNKSVHKGTVTILRK